MALGRLRISSLRCLSDVDVDFQCGNCYIYGANGAGKTSLLEAVHVLGRGRSFRTRDTGKLIQHGTAQVAVYGEVWRDGVGHRLGIEFGTGRLEKRRDGEAAASIAALAELLPVHVIDPSAHDLIEGGPAERRRFLDWGVFHVEPTYLATWRQYRRALAQRNAALKTTRSKGELEAWSAGLAEAGEAVDRFRAGYLSRLRGHWPDVGEALLRRSLSLDYRRGWPDGQSLGHALAASAAADRAAGFTQIGPHRADLIVRSAGAPVRDEASRGQQKLVAAALVLSQVHVQAAGGGAGPVLLVDDPAAELDDRALRSLMEALGRTPAQLLVTSLSEASLAPPVGASVFHVEQGEMRRVV